MKHFCEMIHKSLLREFQYALVWGTSSKHMPQRWAPPPLLRAWPAPFLHLPLESATAAWLGKFFFERAGLPAPACRGLAGRDQPALSTASPLQGGPAPQIGGRGCGAGGRLRGYPAHPLPFALLACISR